MEAVPFGWPVRGYLLLKPERVSTGLQMARFTLATPAGGVVAKHDELGTLDLLPGYVWDGASGPTIRTRNLRGPSAVHDAFYRAMREGQISLTLRKQVDGLFYALMLDAGVPRWRAWCFYWAVRLFGRRYARPRK